MNIVQAPHRCLEIQSPLAARYCYQKQVTHIELAAIICDAPAKSYVLGIKGHSRYFSCPKCTTERDCKH